jgi:hypothetical protein
LRPRLPVELQRLRCGAAGLLDPLVRVSRRIDGARRVQRFHARRVPSRGALVEPLRSQPVPDT